MMLWSYLIMAILVTYSLSGLCSFMAYDIVKTDDGASGNGVAPGGIVMIQSNWF